MSIFPSCLVASEQAAVNSGRKQTDRTHGVGPGQLVIAAATALSLAIPMGSIAPAYASEEAAGGATEEVIVDLDEQSVAVGESEVTITVPGEPSADTVDVDEIPAELFDGEGPAILTTEQDDAILSSYETEVGVQTVIQIESSDAPREYRFPLSLPVGGEAVLFDDGSVALTDESGTAVGGFRAPWAIGANGNAIPTSFRVEGDELIQTIEFDSSPAFPVIADPYLGVQWWGYYVQLTRAETKRAAQIISNNQGPGMLAGVMCSALPAPPAALACATAIALAYFRLVDPISRANSAGKCAPINYPWAVITAPHVGWGSINVTTVKCRS